MGLEFRRLPRVTTTTRFALARAFREDTLYYRCECKGTFPRLRHAVISTFTGRRGDEGHRVFSIPALVAPYAGTMAAVYGWYPGRFNAIDGFRMGNYSLLAYAAGNVCLEFVHSGSHSLLAHLHLNNSHGAPDQEAKAVIAANSMNADSTVAGSVRSSAPVARALPLLPGTDSPRFDRRSFWNGSEISAYSSGGWCGLR